MNFIVYFTFPAFFRTLTSGNVVYLCPFAQSRKGLVLLTSDAGRDNGTIRALQIVITEDSEKALELAVEANEKIEKFLTGKGAITQEGILLTAGLHDAIKYWGYAISYSVEELDEMFESGKDVALL